MQVFNVLSRLIDYPSDELMENLDSVIEFVSDSTEIDDNEKKNHYGVYLLDACPYNNRHSTGLC